MYKNKKSVLRNVTNLLLILMISLGFSLSGFAVEGDVDDDGVLDGDDNCVDVANPGQEDLDDDGRGDGIGSACDLDEDDPVTTKTYSDATEGLIEVQACDYGPINVSGHFITTDTEITLDVEDVSDIDSTQFAVLVPTNGCDGNELEYVGREDGNVYEDGSDCEDANPEQGCVSTYWNYVTDGFYTYNEPFTFNDLEIGESTHKICFFSVDGPVDENQHTEDTQCQVAMVDDNDPVINGTAVEDPMVDIENYVQYGSGECRTEVEFRDPKCAIITVNVTETHIDTDAVKFDIRGLLQQMFGDIDELPSFNEEQYESYLDDRDDTFDYLDREEGSDVRQFEYIFCPSEHIGDLYSSEFSFLSWDDIRKLISEKLELGEFEVDVTVTDEAGKIATDTVTLTVVDLTVPLEVGWNLRSTPINLDGNRIFTANGIDSVLDYNSETQSWEDVTGDNIQEILRGYYMHATERNQYGIIFERDPSVAQRTVHEGWNLVGVALPMEDFYNWPSSCYPDDGAYSNCYVTQLEKDDCDNGAVCVGDEIGFGPLVYDSNGNRALDVVIAPPQELDYSLEHDYSTHGSWYLNQRSKLWAPEIDSEGDSPDNQCSNTAGDGGSFHLKNFIGYWAFTQNEDLLPGFTTTPLPISDED